MKTRFETEAKGTFIHELLTGAFDFSPWVIFPYNSLYTQTVPFSLGSLCTKEQTISSVFL